MAQSETEFRAEDVLTVAETDYEVLEVNDETLDVKRMWDGERLTRDKAFFN